MNENAAPDFELLVRDALDELPDDIRDLMTNVAVTVEDESPRGPNFLGLYEGIPWGNRGPYYAAPCPTRSRSTASPSNGSQVVTPSACAPRCGARSSTRSPTTSGSATS